MCYLVRPACTRCLDTRRLPLTRPTNARRIFRKPTTPCPYC